MSFFGILQKIVKNKEENRDAMTKIDNNVEHESAIHAVRSTTTGDHAWGNAGRRGTARRVQKGMQQDDQADAVQFTDK